MPKPLLPQESGHWALVEKRSHYVDLHQVTSIHWSIESQDSEWETDQPHLYW